jgi:hypothetical protein
MIKVLSWLKMGKEILIIWLRYNIGEWKIEKKKD